MLNKMMLSAGAALFLMTPAWAQNMPVYETTGTIGDEQMTRHTTWNTVPNDPGRQVIPLP